MLLNSPPTSHKLFFLEAERNFHSRGRKRWWNLICKLFLILAVDMMRFLEARTRTRSRNRQVVGRKKSFSSFLHYHHSIFSPPFILAELNGITITTEATTAIKFFLHHCVYTCIHVWYVWHIEIIKLEEWEEKKTHT